MPVALVVVLFLASPGAHAWPVRIGAPAGFSAEAPMGATKAAPASTPRGGAVVTAARAIAARGAPRDCSSFVLAAYERAGHPIGAFASASGSLAEGLYGALRETGRTFAAVPAPGDLAFFRDTFGESRGRVTHVALVDRVESDGTVVMLDRLNSGVQESRVRLGTPHDRAHNSYLRRARKPGEAVLTGELFVAWARP